MTSEKHDPDCVEPIEDRVDILFRELELAIKWQQPSILLAIYSTETSYRDAETKLSKNLSRLGHMVHRLQANTGDVLKLILSQVAGRVNRERTVFFVEGFDWKHLQGQADVNNAFEQSRDFFIKNKIRIVFWLTEANVAGLAHYAPDFWTFRHCSVEFIGLAESVTSQSTAGTAFQHAGESLATEQGGRPVANQAAVPSNDSSDDSQLEGDNVYLMLTQGILSWRKNDYGKAMEYLQSALTVAESIDDHWFMSLCFNSLALVQTSMGRIDGAVDSYEHARNITPAEVFPWSNLGNLYSKLGRNEDAIVAFRKAIEIDSRDAISWNGLGNVYIQSGRAQDAIMAFQKAIECAPNFAYPWNGLGDAYMNTGHSDTAVNAYQKTIELNKDLVNPWISLGHIFKEQNQSVEACRAFEKAVELNPQNAPLWNELGDLYCALNKYSRAVGAYNRAIELDPKYGLPYCNLAFVYTRLGRYAEAIPLYQKSIELMEGDKDRARLWNLLASTFRRLIDYEHAVAAYYSAEKIESGNAAQKDVEKQALAIEDLPMQPEQYDEFLSGVKDDSLEDWKESEKSESLPEPVPASAERSCSNLGSDEDPAISPAMPGKNNSLEVAAVPVANNNARRHQCASFLRQRQISSRLLRDDGHERQNRLWSTWKHSPPTTTFHMDRGDAPQPAQNLMTLEKDSVAVDQLDGASMSFNCQSSKLEAQTPPDADDGAGNSVDEPSVLGGQMSAYTITDVYTETDSITAQEWNEIGKIYFNLGDMDQAILTFNKAIEMNPKLGWSYSNMALAYTQQGRLDEAIFVYKKSIELFRDEKNKAILWNRLGNVYLKLGEDEKAMAAYRMADQLDLETGVTEPNMGNLLPEFDTNNAFVWNEVGRIYYKKGIYDKAIDAYSRAIEIEPGFGWCYSNLALVYLHQRRYAEAIRFYHKSIGLFTSDKDKASSWNRIGDIYRRLNDYDNALGAYQMAIELDPQDDSLVKRARFSLLSNCYAG